MRGVAAPLVKLAIFATVTITMTVVLAVTINGASVGDGVGYRARFSDVTSLNEGDDVRMSGVRVGQVDSMSLVDDRVVEVRFSVAARRKLPASSRAVIKYRNLVGQRYLALEPGDGEPGALPPDATIPLERTTPALDLTLLFNGFKPLFQALSPEDVNKLSMRIIQVLQGEGGTVKSLLAHTASLTSTIAAKDKVIGEVVDNLNAVLKTVNDRGDRLSTLVTTTQQLVSGLAKDRKPIGDAISALADLTDATSGLLGQAREPLRKDLDGLRKLSANLTENSDVLDGFLKRLPMKYENLGRIASYGSWFNFFLCSADAPGVQPAPGGPPVGIPLTAARCGG
ncbi:MCE family protein [Allokutzneria sp. A3M-2-11 16]|uniref:MCE family protein n=1 Tax=Allokutzneria sp. A3M-2-11 16 TaxID=2962043 RepID=UPI0020B8F9CB|nr:MCE family protein [Allokutzneria sp. A3M-2-11 16]MCP3803866.1 MCE family protein [Allokutzneria sp. A3M-2-11 16]